MDSLKVDFIIGRRFPEMTGMDRYARELIAHGEKAIEGQLIAYDFDLPLPGLERLPGLLYYPLVVARRSRPGSIKHLCSHIQAHLLNYLRLQPSVVTCYDIYPYLQRDYPITDKAMVKMGIRGMLKADRIIAISHFTREEIATYLEYPPEKIVAIHLGVDLDRYKPLPHLPGALENYGVPADKKVVLYVGSEQPRKNLMSLVRAFDILRKERDDVVLLKVGRPQWKGAREGLFRLIERLGLRDAVIFVDYVSEDVLPDFYRAADLFAFPSRYEGFGLPPLEAMASGCPVVTTNVSSLPEVVGDAAIMVDPDDIDGISRSIFKVLEDDETRLGMIARGLEKSRQFSWGETFRKTLDLYRDMLL